MSTKAQVQTQAKTPAAPTAARILQPRVGEAEREADRPDIATQLEGAARLGHSLGAISVDSSAPAIIQRQELPEEEEEELQAKPVGALHATIQAKLAVNPPNDICEQEADRVADEVAKSIKFQVQRQTSGEEEELLQGKSIVQTQTPEEKEELLQDKLGIERQMPEEEEELQTHPDDGKVARVAGDIETRIDSARGGGRPLANEARPPMEQAFGADFSGVRVHTDAEADTLNRDLSAKAFTTGQDIFFRQDQYSPGSDVGKKLIAHELTHVVQQRSEKAVKRGLQTGSSVTVQRKELSQDDSNKLQTLLTERQEIIKKFGLDTQILKVVNQAWPDIEEGITHIWKEEREKAIPAFTRAAGLLIIAIVSEGKRQDSKGVALWSGDGADKYAQAQEYDTLESFQVGRLLTALELLSLFKDQWADCVELWKAISSQFATQLALDSTVHVFAAVRPNITEIRSSRIVGPVLWTQELPDLKEMRSSIQKANVKKQKWHVLGRFDRGVLKPINIEGQEEKGATLNSEEEAETAMKNFYQRG